MYKSCKDWMDTHPLTVYAMGTYSVLPLSHLACATDVLVARFVFILAASAAMYLAPVYRVRAVGKANHGRFKKGEKTVNVLSVVFVQLAFLTAPIAGQLDVRFQYVPWGCLIVSSILSAVVVYAFGDYDHRDPGGPGGSA